MSDITEKIALFFKEKDQKIGELIVDAFLCESHELRAEVTEHPTESGHSFVDHVYNLPVRVQLAGIISNTPMTLTGLTVFRSFENWQSGETNDIAEKAFKKLEDIFAQRKPIIISTQLKDYTNMVLESLSVERDSQSSACLKFCCCAVQIRTVNQERISMPKVKRAEAVKDLGKQEAKPVDSSMLNNIKEFFLGPK
jgi:hypothetical protein